MKKNNLISKKHLRILLEQLEQYYTPDFRLEQYPLDTRCASDILYIAFFNFNDIKNKIVIDLGCGTGILSIGAALLGAKKVFAVDIDKESIEIGKKNALKLNVNKKIKWVNLDIEFFKKKGDTVLQNPPFGIRSEKHMDLKFLEKAIMLSKVCYSLHKSGIKNRNFLTNFIENLNAKVTHIIPLKINIPQIYNFHKKKNVEIDVDLYRIIKI